MITSSQNICFRKKDIYFQQAVNMELNYTYKFSNYDNFINSLLYIFYAL